MNKEILRLAVPNILSNVSVPLISSFDTALMGGLGGSHIAAVGMGAMAFNFVYWNFGFLRMSTTGLTAQEYGKGEAGEVAGPLMGGLLLALIFSALLIVLRYPLYDLSTWLLNVQAAEMPLVAEYFLTRVWAAPAAMVQLVVLGWFFGRQNAIWPLVITVLVNGANLGISYYLVVGEGWGIAGVAWGTVAAQYVGLLLCLALLAYTGKATYLPAGAKQEDKRTRRHYLTKNWRRLLSVNRDIFIRTLCLTLSFVFFYNRSNAFDAATATVAANVILLQLVNWLSYGIDGFAYAAESLVGKYDGAGRANALRQLYGRLFAWGMGLAGLYALIYGLGGASLLSLFAPAEAAPEALATALYYLPAVVAFCLLATPCYLLDGIFIGLTRAADMRTTMIYALGIYLLAYYGLGRDYGNWGLWASLLIFMVARGVLLWRRL